MQNTKPTKPNPPNQTYQTKPTKPNLPNQTFQTKPTKPNLPNQTYQTKPTKPNPPNQTYQTKPTKTNPPSQTYQTKSNLYYQAYWSKPAEPKLLVKAVNAWVRSAFGNVSYRKQIKYISKKILLNRCRQKCAAHLDQNWLSKGSRAWHTRCAHFWGRNCLTAKYGLITFL